MVQGGYYWKGFAKHGPLHNPRTYGYFDAIAYDGPKRGGHVTPGGIIYKGDAYPPAFRGAFIGGNLLSNTVYWHDLRPDGSTFRGKHGGTLIDARDPWFRPIDLTHGPDGCVYVVDWYDRRASHLDPRDTWDKTNGRIYRVVYGERKKLTPFDLGKLSTDALIDLRTSANDWQAETARRILAERRDPSAIGRLKSLLGEDRDEVVALRDLWALHVSGGLDDATALELLAHPMASVRRWTVRLVGDDHRMNSSLAASLRHLAETDPDPLVRSQLASSCQRWPAAEAFPIIDALLSRSEDAKDPHIPLLLWWACESHLSHDHFAAVNHVIQPDFLGRRLVRAAVVERLARWLISTGDPHDDQAVEEVLYGVASVADVDKVVAGMLKGLEGRRVGEIPPALRKAVARVATGEGLDRQRLALRLGDQDAYERALTRVADPNEADAVRLAFLDILAQMRRDGTAPVLMTLVAREPKPSVRLAALSALGTYDRAEIADTLLAGYSAFPKPLQSRAIDLLTSRRPWASRLVDAMASGRIAAKDVTNAQAQSIARLGDDALKSRLESAWGRLPGPGLPEKIRRIAEVRGMLVEGDKGNAARGARRIQGRVCRLPSPVRRGREDRARADPIGTGQRRLLAHEPRRPERPDPQGIPGADDCHDGRPRPGRARPRGERSDDHPDRFEAAEGLDPRRRDRGDQAVGRVAHARGAARPAQGGADSRPVQVSPIERAARAMTRPSLPIDAAIPAILDAIRLHHRLVLVAPPGAGKTTRLPPALVGSGLLAKDHPNVLVLQPRRVAARSVAARIAGENGWTLGEEVGYQVRFEKKIGPKTRLRVITEGILNRQVVADPFLEGVGAVVLDEFHERSLHTDLALAFLKEVRESVRGDLILVVTSATMDAGPVAAFLGDAPIVRVEGRTFPVEITHRPGDGSPLHDRMARAIAETIQTSPDRGDVLAFLPGVEEIRRTARELGPVVERHDLLVLPLHGSLSSEVQDRALRPSDRRKIVLATNIAETSLTIEGITTVIDSGLARFASFDAGRGVDRLELGRISRASATQRAGRAGRTRPGRCVRLWSEREERGMAETDVAEVHRVDLSGTLLALHAWGADPSSFAWFEKPAAARIEAAGRVLEMLGAVESGRITADGRRLLDIPAAPRVARLLWAANAAGLLRQGAAVAALLGEKDIMTRVDHRSRPDSHAESDVLIRLDRLEEAEAARFGPSLRVRGIDPAVARRVAQARDDYMRVARRWPAASPPR